MILPCLPATVHLNGIDRLCNGVSARLRLQGGEANLQLRARLLSEDHIPVLDTPLGMSVSFVTPCPGVPRSCVCMEVL